MAHNLPDSQRTTLFTCLTFFYSFSSLLFRSPLKRSTTSGNPSREHPIWRRQRVYFIVYGQTSCFLFFFSLKISDLCNARIKSESLLPYIGTPCYLSPEVFREEEYSFPNDIWGLGVIAYELCTLNHPFMGSSIPSVLNNILNVAPPPIPQIDEAHKQESGLRFQS